MIKRPILRNVGDGVRHLIQDPATVLGNQTGDFSRKVPEVESSRRDLQNDDHVGFQNRIIIGDQVRWLVHVDAYAMADEVLPLWHPQNARKTQILRSIISTRSSRNRKTTAIRHRKT